jgi:hypothetical protein
VEDMLFEVFRCEETDTIDSIAIGQFLRVTFVKVLWKYFDKGSSYSGPLSTWSKCTRGGTWAAPMGYTKCQILQLIFNLGVLNYQKVDNCWSKRLCCRKLSDN